MRNTGKILYCLLYSNHCAEGRRVRKVGRHMQIEIEVTGQKIKRLNSPGSVADTLNYLTCSYDCQWIAIF